MAKGTINKIFLLGRVGAEPEEKKGVVLFSLATNSGYKDKEDQWVDKTDWHAIVAYGKKADFCKTYVKKGSLVHIEGKITYYISEKDDGTKSTRTSIAIGEITLISTGKPGIED